MSYNPARASGKALKKRRNYDPHAGVKHSDIMRRKGVGFDATTSEREDTKHGFTSPVCSFKKFTQRYVCIYAGNNTGVGVNPKADRTIRVMVGTLYVTLVEKVKEVGEDDKVNIVNVADIQTFAEGHSVALERGTMYSLSSSGNSNVELLITEDTGYQDSWKELEEAVVTKPVSVMIVPPRTAAPRRPRSDSKAYQQALQQSGKKGEVAELAENRRRSSGENVNSSAIVGVNPRPSGPPPSDD